MPIILIATFELLSVLLIINHISLSSPLLLFIVSLLLLNWLVACVFTLWFHGVLEDVRLPFEHGRVGQH